MLSFPPSAVRRILRGLASLDAPQPICDASGHSRGRAKCTMNLDEVVGKIIEGRSSGMVRQLARKSIRQARITAHGCAKPPVLTLHERRRNVFVIGGFRSPPSK